MLVSLEEIRVFPKCSYTVGDQCEIKMEEVRM